MALSKRSRVCDDHLVKMVILVQRVWGGARVLLSWAVVPRVTLGVTFFFFFSEIGFIEI